MMDFLASEALMNEFYAAVWPENHGVDYPTEWAQFQPGAPLFPIPKTGPRPWPFPMLVEFDDGR